MWENRKLSGLLIPVFEDQGQYMGGIEQEALRQEYELRCAQRAELEDQIRTHKGTLQELFRLDVFQRACWRRLEGYTVIGSRLKELGREQNVAQGYRQALQAIRVYFPPAQRAGCPFRIHLINLLTCGVKIRKKLVMLRLKGFALFNLILKMPVFLCQSQRDIAGA